MWVFLSNSFLSVVADKNDSDFVWVRARVKGDIEKLFPCSKVTRTPKRDYLFRTRLHKHEVANVMAGKVLDINYTNFKDSVPKKEVRRHDSYLRVWNEMFRLQESAKLKPKAKPFSDGHWIPKEWRA
jgi:hypothetical protein